MTVINKTNAKELNPALYTAAHKPRWRTLHRIDTVSASTDVVSDAIFNYTFDRLLYAEGDSWFDKYTPLFFPGTNLLEALRLPMFAGVVDVAHIGDLSCQMVVGHQRQQTEAMFRLFDFDAILFSGGGNDLKNLFADVYDKVGRPLSLTDPLSFNGVIDSIKAFVAMRDACPNPKTRAAPIFVNGYDYFQPRPVKGAILGDLLKTVGPWLYPSLHKAGLSDAEMLAAAITVIDELNARLQREIATLPNVHVIDQRGLLTLAAPGSTSASGDWLDEIHPTAEGFAKLAQSRWNYALATALGWVPLPGEVQSPVA